MTILSSRIALTASMACAGTLWLATPQMALGQEDEAQASEADAAEAAAVEAPAAEALASNQAAVPPGLPTELPKNLKADGKPDVPSTPTGILLSNGSPVTFEALGFSIAPPAGWQYEAATGSLSLIMEEPKVEAPDYAKPKYQRNVTVAAIQEPSPIDEKRATELEGQLTKQFGADSSVSNFTVIEHKFFNYRGANDGLIVYTSMSLGEYPMMQMHVLVSGQNKQFLLTYTDLAERFSDAKDGNFEKAWNSIVSIDVVGPSPTRQNDLVRYGALAGGLALFGLIGFFLSRRVGSVDFSDLETFEDSGEGPQGSMMATLAGEWKIGGKGDAYADGDDGMDFTGDASPLTQKTEYISNF